MDAKPIETRYAARRKRSTSMTIEIQIARCRLIHGDSRAIVNTLKIDAIITDPVWPNAPREMFPGVDPTETFGSCMQAMPASVKRLAVHLGGNSDPRFLTSVPARLAFFRTVSLEYAMPGMVGRLLMHGDTAYLFGEPPPSRDGNHLISGRCVVSRPDWEKHDHPCPRQVAHAQWLIEKFTDPGDVVCDMFMGSGTTALACMLLDREFVGLECNQSFFQTTVERCRKLERDLKNRLPFDEPASPLNQSTLGFTP